MRIEKAGRQDGQSNQKFGKKPFKKGNRRDNKGFKKPKFESKDPQARKEQLDREMETYWLKSGNKDLGK